MTSKEALELIRKFEPFGYDNDGREEYPLSGTLNDYLEDELNAIEKDLEVLDTLKKHLWIISLITGEEVCSFYDDGIYSFTDNEEFNIIKEWLEDEE